MASGSKFFSHLRIWVLAIPILMVTVIPLVNEEWIYTVSDKEEQTNRLLFGDEEYDQIEKATENQFVDWWIKTGLYRKTVNEKRADTGNLNFGKPANGFVNTYFTNLWKMVYRAQYRLHIAFQWMIGAIILIFSFMYDGWQKRNIKMASFGYSHPLKFHLVTHGMLLLIGLSVTLCFIPIAITPQIWLGGTVLMALLGWKMMESFQA